MLTVLRTGQIAPKGCFFLSLRFLCSLVEQQRDFISALRTNKKLIYKGKLIRYATQSLSIKNLVWVLSIAVNVELISVFGISVKR